MLKGINKQIIEIKCPKNEQYEKILLFTRTDCDVNRFCEIDDDMLEIYREIVKKSKDETKEKHEVLACIVMLTLTTLFLLAFLVYTLL